MSDGSNAAAKREGVKDREKSHRLSVTIGAPQSSLYLKGDRQKVIVTSE